MEIPTRHSIPPRADVMRGMQDLPRVMKPKHRLTAAIFKRTKVLSVVLDALEVLMKASRIPLLGRFHPFLRPANNHLINLPVKVDIPLDSTALPPDIARELIRKAKYHHVLDKCLCRHGRDCKHHSHDIGCIFLGQTGFDVTPGFSRRITMEEALEHLDKALADGLTPSTGGTGATTMLSSFQIIRRCSEFASVAVAAVSSATIGTRR
jgi:hypothetical protein